MGVNSGSYIPNPATGLEYANLTTYSNEIANSGADGEYFVHAPDAAVGVAAAVGSTGQPVVYATDADWSLVTKRAKHSATNWLPWSANETAFGAPRKMAAANLQDNRQSLYVLNSSGLLWARWENTLGGSWSGWQNLAGPSGVTMVDVATTGGSGQVTQMFALGSTGTVHTAFKTGGANSAWSAWCPLGTVTNATDLAAIRFGSTQMIVVASSSASVGLRMAFSTQSPCSSWSTLASFGEASAYQAVTAGLLADGRVHVVAARSGTIRGRIRALDGSAWSSWGNLLGPPSLPVGAAFLNGLATTRDSDGREVLFLLGSTSNGLGNEIFMSKQTASTGAQFSAWTRFYK